jgi:hypothetical protein
LTGDVLDWTTIGIQAAGPALLVLGVMVRERRRSLGRAREWEQRADKLDRIIDSWEEVSWELSLNGFRRNRAGEPDLLRARSQREMIVELAQTAESNAVGISDLRVELRLMREALKGTP